MLPWSYKLLTPAQREALRTNAHWGVCGTAAACASTATWKFTYQRLPGCTSIHLSSGASPLQSQLFGVLRGDKQSEAIQRLKLLQSLVIAGALIAYCLMASWALTQRCQIADEQNHRNRKFTLFPVFTNDKTFLTVIVLCFSEGMRNLLLPSTAAQSSHLMPKITALLAGNLPY